MKKFLPFLLCFFSINVFSQISSLDYLMKYNCETNQYDVHIVILEGSANSIPHRAQFNSQVSLVVPTGESVQITDMYMPLQNNFNYEGTIPLIWFLGTPVVAPAAQPEHDFYGVTPTLSPASLYNDLAVGDIVKIFSFTAGTTGQYDENVRFYINGVDPISTDPGMGGGSFSNGFTIGGSLQLYNDNSVENCLTSTNPTLHTEAKIYPNPFENQFTIELSDDVDKVSVFDSNGKLYYHSAHSLGNVLTINSSSYTKGIYFVKLEYNNGSFESHKMVKL